MTRGRTQIVMHLLYRDECKADAILAMHGRMADVRKPFSSHLQNATVIQSNFPRKRKLKLILIIRGNT